MAKLWVVTYWSVILSFSLPIGGAPVLGDPEGVFVQVAEEISRSVVPLWRGDPEGGKPFEIAGSGFWVGSDGILATSLHMVQSGTLTIPYQGEWLPCKVLKDSFQEVSENETITWDVALLEVRGIDERVFPVQLSSREYFKLGESVAAFGFLLEGRTFTIGKKLSLTGLLTKGIVSAHHALFTSSEFLGSRLVLDLTAGPGSSGSPVFEPETGLVLGIISSGKRNQIAALDPGEIRQHLGDGGSGIVFAEPVYPILKWLRARRRIDY